MHWGCEAPPQHGIVRAPPSPCHRARAGPRRKLLASGSHAPRQRRHLAAREKSSEQFPEGVSTAERALGWLCVMTMREESSKGVPQRQKEQV